MIQHWYAIYTKHNAEQKLQQAIDQHNLKFNSNYSTYLPLRTEVKQWSDRQKKISLPLFNNYLFVKHDESGFNKIQYMPGFSFYIRFGKLPSVIPDEQMNLIQQVVKYQQGAVSSPTQMMKGDLVKVHRGPLKGHQGVLIKDQDNKKVAIEIKSLKMFLHVEIPTSDVVPVTVKNLH